MIKVPPYGSVSYDTRYVDNPVRLDILSSRKQACPRVVGYGTLVKFSMFGPACERFICA